MKHYQVPGGMTEEAARGRMAELLLQVREIEAQLGDREREATMEPDAYEAWRVKAKSAWGWLMDEYRALKDWVNDQKNAATGSASGHITSGIGLLRKGLDRVRQLEHLHDVVVAYLREDTDESYTKLEEAVRALGGGELIDDRDRDTDTARAS